MMRETKWRNMGGNIHMHIQKRRASFHVENGNFSCESEGSCQWRYKEGGQSPQKGNKEQNNLL